MTTPRKSNAHAIISFFIFLTFFKFHSKLDAFLDKFLEIIERQPYIILAHPQPNIPTTSNFY